MSSKRNTDKGSGRSWLTKKRRVKGFTLVEITAVITLLMILTAAGFSYRHLRGLYADSFVRGFASDIRHIYRRSVYSDRQTQLDYLFEGKEGKKGQQISGYEIREEGLIVKTVRFPEDLQVRSTNDLEKIEFLRSGQFRWAGETIRIEDRQSGKRFRLTIVPFSGRVEVYLDE